MYTDVHTQTHIRRLDFLSHTKHTVHFRIPRAKKSRLHQSLDSTSKWVQIWLIGILLPIAWEIWAFPFRLAFCDIELNKALFVYSIDVTCDMWFLLDVTGVYAYFVFYTKKDVNDLMQL